MILHDWMSWPDSEITWRVPSYPADDDTSDDAELARRLFVYVEEKVFRSMTSRLEVLDWLRRVMLLEDLADV